MSDKIVIALVVLAGWISFLTLQNSGYRALSAQTASIVSVTDNLARECSAKTIVRDSTFKTGEFSDGPMLNIEGSAELGDQ